MCSVRQVTTRRWSMARRIDTIAKRAITAPAWARETPGASRSRHCWSHDFGAAFAATPTIVRRAAAPCESSRGILVPATLSAAVWRPDSQLTSVCNCACQTRTTSRCQRSASRRRSPPRAVGARTRACEPAIPISKRAGASASMSGALAGDGRAVLPAPRLRGVCALRLVRAPAASPSAARQLFVHRRCQRARRAHAVARCLRAAASAQLPAG